MIADFGIARAIEAAGTTRLTQTGVAIGTAAYMSPEQASGSGRVDARSDLYSLGCVLYEMLAGRPPFVGPTAESVIYQQVAADPPGLDGLRPGLPAPVAEMIERLMAKLPADRFAGAEQAWSAGAAVAALAAVGAWATLAGPCRPAGGVIRSLAVLPLDNLSGDPSQDSFVDGVTEELINHLSQIAALRVISRASVMSLKGARLSIPEVARRLHVDGIVEGSVTRIGDQVKVSAELVQSSPERQLWAKSFEREVRNILALQGDLAAAIADELRLRLSPEERTRVAAVRTVNPNAHDAYLKGRFYLGKLEQRGLRRAVESFRQAVEIDPLYAQGWAGVGDAYYMLSNMYLAPQEAMPQARAAAQKALQLDPNLAEAHASLGVVLAAYDWDWTAAEREYRRALALNPSLEQAHVYYACLLECEGRFEEAIQQWRRAVELNPLSPLEAARSIWLY